MPGALFSDTVASAVPIVAMLAYLPHGIKYSLMLAQQGVASYNHQTPRETNIDVVFASQPATAELCKRCVGCHINGLEALGFFGSGVAFAVARGVSNVTIAQRCNEFIALRCVYTIAYLVGNKPLSYVRTACFFGGLYVIGQLFAAGAL